MDQSHVKKMGALRFDGAEAGSEFTTFVEVVFFTWIGMAVKCVVSVELTFRESRRQVNYGAAFEDANFDDRPFRRLLKPLDHVFQLVRRCNSLHLVPS